MLQPHYKDHSSTAKGVSLKLPLLNMKQLYTQLAGWADLELDPLCNMN